MNQYERQTAYITDIVTLLGGQFVKGEAQIQPSYVIASGKKFSRVHIIAVIVAITGNEATLDDGTGKIVARSFENPGFFTNIQLGDIVRIIGKVRAFNEQIYIIPEIIKKMTNREWVTFHKLQHRLHRKQDVHQEMSPDIAEEIIDDIDPAHTISQTPSEDILQQIKDLDTGDGAQIEAIIAGGGLETEKIIQNLLETGDVFEIRPGRIKVLE